MTLKTLGDVRKLLSHLPKDVRARSTWQGVANQLDTAARGADPADVAVALQLTDDEPQYQVRSSIYVFPINAQKKQPA